MRYCTKCCFPAISATPLTFDENGICSGCRASELKNKINWDERKQFFKELVDEYRTNDYYDCVLPVSGGKDSYFAAHICKEFNLKPLMVTYHGNNYMKEGEKNLQKMRNVFDADHIIYKPSEKMLIKLNRLGFKITGDMNWHAHAGIFTYPMQIAVKYKIPLVFWGDHGFTEQGGMYSHNDFFEYTSKDRYEHALHGFDWFDFIEETENLTKKDLQSYIYPKDEDIMEVGVRGIFLSNYFYYDGNYNAEIAKKYYGWEAAEQKFDRTYRKISNIDDMHENGIHDYMKFIKIGYGRGTDHANYDIRLGKMTRAEGIEMVKKYDHVKPSDLKRWLEYVNMTENEFDRIADTFRNPRVWRIENNQWVKDNIWGGSSVYGKVKNFPKK
jgi:N-acetyl sugar amidotransferase